MNATRLSFRTIDRDQVLRLLCLRLLP
jgi:hypothetical protein